MDLIRLGPSEAKEQGTEEALTGAWPQLPFTLSTPPHSRYIPLSVPLSRPHVLRSLVLSPLRPSPKWTRYSMLVAIPKDAEFRTELGCSDWLLTGPTGDAPGCDDSLLWTGY